MLKSLHRFTALGKAITFPSAFLFSILLTIIVFTLAITVENQSLFHVIDYWGEGIFNLLKFSAQMALILICGSALAKTHLVNNFLDKSLRYCNTQVGAVMTVTIVSILGCYFNWGFGLVLSAVMVNKVYKKTPQANFGLLVSSAYSGFLVWHGGISGSIPLKITEQGFSLSQTLFSNFNLFILVSVVITILIVNYTFSKFCKTSKITVERSDQLVTKHFSNSYISKTLISFLAVASFIYLFRYFSSGRLVSLNIMIFIFLMMGIVLAGSIDKYSHLFKKSVEDSYGILLQFPFYAGLMSVMDKSGLALSISQYFIDISTTDSFLINTYLSAGLLNFFVPSGGGQWVIQGPIILPAAKVLNIDVAQASMAIAWGDAWSNMIQPFWALPILSVAQASLRDIFFHCIVLFIAVGVVTLTVISIN